MCMWESMGCLWDGLSQWGFFLSVGKRENSGFSRATLTCFWEERECRLTDHSFYKHIFEPLQTQPTRVRGNRSSFSPLLLLGLFVEQLGGVVLSDTHILHTHTHTQTDVHRHVPLNQRGVWFGESQISVLSCLHTSCCQSFWRSTSIFLLF